MGRHRARKLAVVAGVAAVAVGLLALASFLTTQEDWDGGFPKGEFRIAIRDRDGRPVPGAVVRAYGATTGLPADADGRVTMAQPRGGFQFGGHRWRLFWAVPMGDQPPGYVWEVTAAGFRPHRVGWPELNAAPRSTDEPTARWDQDPSAELPVYEVPVTLER